MPVDVQERLRHVRRIYATNAAFAALLHDGDLAYGQKRRRTEHGLLRIRSKGHREEERNKKLLVWRGEMKMMNWERNTRCVGEGSSSWSEKRGKHAETHG